MKQNSKDSQKRSGGIFAGKDESGNGIGFDWGSVPEGRLHEIIILVTGRGGAIRFGYSRDGSAGSIGVYYGDDRDTLYLRPSGDVEDTLGLIERTFGALPFSAGKSPNQGH